MITRKARRQVYANPWMQVFEDDVAFADGTPGIYGVVEKADFAVIVPRLPDGRLQMVQLYRYPVSARFWEFPQGGWEGEGAVDPKALAARELAEETGLRAGGMASLGSFFESYGYAKQLCHAFLATELEEGATDHDSGEIGMRSQAFSRTEIGQMIKAGEVKDSVTIAALALLDMFDAG